MRVSMATISARAGRVNEDFAGAVPGAAVLLDGAGIAGAESVCRHGVAWFAARLGGCLLALLTPAPDRPLAALLAEAIVEVTDLHRDSCAVADPVSPSATVAMLRVAGGTLDYLVLGDSFLVLDRLGEAPLVVTDPREVVIARRYEQRLERGEERGRVLRELRAHRNRPGGFWLAKDDPRAAAEAITGSCPVSALRGAVLLSNGVETDDWSEVLALSPAEAVARFQRSDDATVVSCTGLG